MSTQPTQPITLYRHPLSGHSHRAQLFLSLAGIPARLVDVDLMKGAHKQPDFLKLNVFGQVPVSDDGGTGPSPPAPKPVAPAAPAPVGG